jgi:hypothetical protein
MPISVNQIKNKKTVDKPSEQTHGPAEPIHGRRCRHSLDPLSRRVLHRQARSGLPAAGVDREVEEERRRPGS